MNATYILYAQDTWSGEGDELTHRRRTRHYCQPGVSDTDPLGLGIVGACGCVGVWGCVLPAELSGCLAAGYPLWGEYSTHIEDDAAPGEDSSSRGHMGNRALRWWNCSGVLVCVNGLA